MARYQHLSDLCLRHATPRVSWRVPAHIACTRGTSTVITTISFRERRKPKIPTTIVGLGICERRNALRDPGLSRHRLLRSIGRCERLCWPSPCLQPPVDALSLLFHRQTESRPDRSALLFYRACVSFLRDVRRARDRVFPHKHPRGVDDRCSEIILVLQAVCLPRVSTGLTR